MFELEVFRLLNDIKTADDQYSINQDRHSLCRLIKENPQEFQNLLQSPNLDQESQQILDDCAAKNQEEEEQQQKAQQDNTQVIKQYYQEWLNQYRANNQQVNDQQLQLLQQLVNYYAPQHLETLKKLTSISDTDEYEVFKNVLLNVLRSYYAERIKRYYTSDAFKQLSFFERRKKKQQILSLLDEIGQYQFDQEKIQNTLR